MKPTHRELDHTLISSHFSIIRSLRTACFARILRCTALICSLPSSLAPEFMTKRFMFMNRMRRFHTASTHSVTRPRILKDESCTEANKEKGYVPAGIGSQGFVQRTDQMEIPKAGWWSTGTALLNTTWSKANELSKHQRWTRLRLDTRHYTGHMSALKESITCNITAQEI